MNIGFIITVAIALFGWGAMLWEMWGGGEVITPRTSRVYLTAFFLAILITLIATIYAPPTQTPKP